MILTHVLLFSFKATACRYHSFLWKWMQNIEVFALTSVVYFSARNTLQIMTEMIDFWLIADIDNDLLCKSQTCHHSCSCLRLWP